MAKRVGRGSSATKVVRRAVRREVKKALEGLTDRRPAADEAIHDSRKRLKRARAALRLGREALGPRGFRRDNDALRDAARPLSEIRDAKILIDTLDGLIPQAAPADRGALRRVHSDLVATKQAARRRVLGRRAVLKPALQSMEAVRARTERWPNRGRGWSVLGVGLRRVYRAGRDAYQAARENPTVDHLHELRKQVKYLWHQLQMIEPLRPPVIARLADRAHTLSDQLGDDHDLAVLARRLTRTRRSHWRAASAALAPAIDRRRKALQAKALRLGARVYEERPRDFERRMKGYWRS